MARIAGVDLPRNKRVEIALTYLFGVGRSLSNEILEKASIDPNKKSDELNDDDFPVGGGDQRTALQGGLDGLGERHSYLRGRDAPAPSI